ncbi:MAG: glutamine--fructose-6-phosphate transaminase (isomerizing) [Clostridia bacterium]|nr:glutamine--fructose-6-phosphate transaminase (isomerizing) [Clostridia bacterium]
MCGIIGKIGEENVVPALVDGLKKLEYRGYDSSGVAVETAAGLDRVRSVGKIRNLEQALEDRPLSAKAGIGHTRWATHGKPSEANAHPHYSPDAKFAVVHNGIIENADEIKAKILPPDAKFASETDTEVIAHLLQKFYTGDPVQAIAETEKRLRGSYALAILCTDHPETLFAAACGSPLIAAKCADGLYVSSDVGTLSQPQTVYRLRQKEIAMLQNDTIRLFDETGAPIRKEPEKISADAILTDKGDYEHYMLFEIMQQPEAVRRTLIPLLQNGETSLEAYGLSEDFIKNDLQNIEIVACGSAYHTGLAAARLFEELAKIPCRAQIASEFRYAEPVIGEHTLTVFVSQSGETADTLAALRLSKAKHAKILSIVNVAGSAIATESDCVIPTKAGREIAVATTKAYSAQLAVFYALAVRTAFLRGAISADEQAKLVHELGLLPDKIEETLQRVLPDVKKLADEIADRSDMFFIGRQMDFAAATEGSLKMKEISYLNSQAYAAGELKHGTISLIEDGTPVIAVAADEKITDKTVSNICEVKARGALTVAVTTDALKDRFSQTDRLITVPETNRMFSCSLTVVPLQLLSYYTAKNRGCDIDKPKNLAKSVTVE